MIRVEDNLGRFPRCLICGMRLYTSKTPRCEWCEEPMIHEILHSLLEHIAEFLKTNEPTSPKVDLGMAFVADIGELATRHPYFTSLKNILTMLLERGVVKRIPNAERIWGANLLLDAKRVLPLFNKINLCGLSIGNDGNVIIEWPTGSIIKRAHSWLETEPGRNETASFLLGFVVLHAIDETIEALDTNKTLTFSEGVARLYPIEYDGDGRPKGLRLPKGITSVVSFVLGSWARGWTEFDEFTLHRFLDMRGVTGKEYNEAIGLLSQTVPGISHTILEYETYSQGGVPIKRFRYSEPVLTLRKHLRNRIQERVRT